MFGFRYIKFDPTQYVIVYKGGKVQKEGPGLAFWYFVPSTSLVEVPLGSSEAHFIFEEVTADFQEVTVQGQVTFRISDAQKASQLLNYTLDRRGERYISQDPEKLQQRVVNAINVLVRSQVQGLNLRDAITRGDSFADEITPLLATRQDIKSLGLEILGLSILAVKPNPETARALEAETREQLMKEADDAVYVRRNASVDHERSIKENELQTEQSIQEKRHELESADTSHSIQLEERRKDLVAKESDNSRTEAEARAYALEAIMKSLTGADPRVVQSLAATKMQPDALIAAAMTELAANAEHIGELNISPDMLRELMKNRGGSE